MIKLNNVEISQEDLIKEITGNKELMDTLKAKFGKKESGWFVPEVGENYWFLSECDIFHDINGDFGSDKDIFNSQQVFRTQKEAIKADQQRMAKVRILKRIAEENAKNGWVCDWNNHSQAKYVLEYSHNDEKLYFDYFYSRQTRETGFHMSEVLEELCTELLEDYKIYLGVE